MMEANQHACDAFDRYRRSVKEQRAQGLRRHEHITRLSREGARLVVELSHAQQALRSEQERGRRLTVRIEALQAVEQRCGTLEA